MANKLKPDQSGNRPFMKSTPFGVCFFVLEVGLFALGLMLVAYQQSGFVLHGFTGASHAAASQHAGAAAAVVADG